MDLFTAKVGCGGENFLLLHGLDHKGSVTRRVGVCALASSAPKGSRLVPVLPVADVTEMYLIKQESALSCNSSYKYPT